MTRSLQVTRQSEDERDVKLPSKALSQQLVEVRETVSSMTAVLTPPFPQSPLYPPGAAPAGEVAVKPALVPGKETKKVCELFERRVLTAMQPLLPPGWAQHVTKTPRKRIYYSRPDGGVQWQPPPAAPAAPALAAAPGSRNLML